MKDLKQVSKQQRLLALALLLVLLASVAVAFQKTWLKRYTNYHVTIKQSQQQIARAQALIAEQPDLLKAKQDLEAESNHNEQLLPESNPALAGTALQQKIKKLLEQNQGTLLSMQALPAQTRDDGFVRVAIRAQIRIQPKGLRGFLYQVESGSPSLFIDSARISTDQAVRNRIMRPGQPPLPPQITTSYVMDIEIAGYLLPKVTALEP